MQISETENSAQIQIWDFVGNGPFSSFDKHTLRRDYIRGIQNYSFWARATTALRFWKWKVCLDFQRWVELNKDNWNEKRREGHNCIALKNT